MERVSSISSETSNSNQGLMLLCPFNAYHKMPDYRKLQFHVSRCVNISLIFLERNSSDEGALNLKCERNIESFNQETQERIIAEAQIRLPSCTYCRYNVDHSFKTLKDRETHEELCPDRAAYERKNSQTSEIYNRHKQYIE